MTNEKNEEKVNSIPKWISELADEDLNFIKRFVLSSGSLKEMAGLFMVYTAGLLLTLSQVYCYMLDTGGSLQSYHQLTMLALFMANIVVIFAGIFYYVIRGKRKLSREDKMKLMDL